VKQLWALILAAGEGKRMYSRLPKVLHPLCGRRMLSYILGSAAELTKQVLIVVGHGASQVRETFGDNWNYVLQKQQLGTGHAVMEALKALPQKGTLLVLCGDTPLLETSYLKKLLEHYEQHAAVVASTKVPDPTGYGRVIRGRNGLVERIVEDKDASIKERETCEINTGTYCFDIELLRYYLPRLTTENIQNEYYLPDVLFLMHQDGLSVGAYCIEDYRVGLGINNRVQLAEAVSVIQNKITNELMLKGVTIDDPGSVHIDYDVQIGTDTVIRPDCVIEKGTVIGKECRIGPGTHLYEAVINDQAVVQHSVVNKSSIKSGSVVGPFAHISAKKMINNE